MLKPGFELEYKCCGDGAFVRALTPKLGTPLICVLSYMGDACKRCFISYNKKLILVDSSVDKSLDDYGLERTQTIFVHEVELVLVSRAEQASQP